MSDNYMPTTEEVLDAWVDLTTAADSRAHLVEAAVEASRRRLAAIEGEAAARALSEAAMAFEATSHAWGKLAMVDHLRARAAEYRKAKSDAG